MSLSLSELYDSKWVIPGSDRQGDKGTQHSYIEAYEELLASRRLTATSVLEIGVWQGTSIGMWADYFENAHVYGIDVNPIHANCQYVEVPMNTDSTEPWSGVFPEVRNNPRITLCEGDGTTEAGIENCFSGITFDVIIDDGSHWIEHQLDSMRVLWPRLNKGGIYIIEDITVIDTDRPRFESLVNEVDPIPKTFKIVDLRAVKNRFDDVLAIYTK